MKEKTDRPDTNQCAGRHRGASGPRTAPQVPPRPRPRGAVSSVACAEDEAKRERTPRELAAAIRNALTPAVQLTALIGEHYTDAPELTMEAADAREGLERASGLLHRFELAAEDRADRAETEAATALGQRAPEPLYHAAWAALWDGDPPRDGDDEIEPLYTLCVREGSDFRCECCGDRLGHGDRYANALVSSRPALDGRGAVHVRARLCLVCLPAHLSGWLLELVAKAMPFRTRVAAEPAEGGQ